MRLIEYIVLAVSSLFVIVDPIATVPSFIAMTHDDTPSQRTRTAGLACVVMAVVLLIFAFAGKWVFKFLGITMPAFQMAASIVLLLVALDMLRAQRSRVKETSEETEAALSKAEIAITPLAIPMLAGPGAISTAILLHARAESRAHDIGLAISIVVVSFASYLILRFSARSVRFFTPIAMKIMTRIMGLLLAAVASQFLLNAIKEFRKEL